ncbi:MULTISPECIES: glycosyltransferase family 25 protein [Polynucleobacter]|uniref:glycosyltransferase family 25 protein n=1 Tax=Polynucleobacter TaxID=44013 RepID=UPI001BFE7292|nr:MULTISPECIES: glycosyltransferase family 25 protein [Polynucleobacter]MBU3546655.1 glycosyltransferase family 25 protein [Polynucleobacter sp. MWH-Jannik1A5]QWE08889.1 glycosyltransferase family 25 protein [Polynucleobacter ibericus]
MPEIQGLVISLAGSEVRQQKVKSELDKTNLHWRFLDAVRGSALTNTPKEYQPGKVKNLLGFELTPNELGCFLSHKKAWQDCVDKNIPTIIFEDDFCLLPHFEKAIHFLVNESTNWDAVRLQGLSTVPQEKIQGNAEFSLVRNIGDAVGATAYLLKPSAAQTLIDASSDIYEPLDHFLEHHQKHHLEFLAISPYPVDITGVETTIADRPSRLPIRGWHKTKRSILRALDRWFSKNPWFPS